jgi:hypothetical protein
MLTLSAIYRVSLALKGKESRSEVDLKELLDDLVGAKDEYNALNSQGHRMLLLEPTRKRLNLLFKPGQGQSFQHSMLDHFSEILKEGFDWQAYCDRDGALLEVKVAQQLPRVEWQHLLIQLQEADNHQIMGDPELENLLGRSGRGGMGQISRRFARGDGEAEPETNLEEALQQLDGLVGLDELKAEVYRVVDFIGSIKENGQQLPAREAYPFHYICTTDGVGVGLSSALKLMAAIFYHLEICPLYGCIEERVDKENGYLIDHRFDENGICAAVGADLLEESELEELIDKLVGEFRDQVVVLVLDAGQKRALAKLQHKLKQQGVPFRRLHLPAYSEPQMVEIFKRILKPYGCQLDLEGEKLFKAVLGQMREDNSVCGARTLKDIACRMALEVLSKPRLSAAGKGKELKGEAINRFLRALPLEESDANGGSPGAEPLGELDKLVGLSAVKDRIREILAHFVMEKKKADLGIRGERLCMHMLFTGNPGSGKTTVARIVGQVLKAEGLLEKGDLVEVSREDLVALYIGHTAIKTASVIEKSLGSVLFIDEAYALNGGSERDFGQEALATLVKKMEEHKDELVVIMAGYTDEMEKMIALNPGLTSRVPHKIEFPDYSGEELYAIFGQQLGEDYRISAEAVEKLQQLFVKAATSADKRGGNGRFVRNVAERLKMKQGIRLLKHAGAGREELLQIIVEDVENLLKDNDISRVLRGGAKHAIGFGQD